MAMFGRRRSAKNNTTSTINNRPPQIEMNDHYSNSNDDSVTPPHASSEKQQRLPHHNSTQRRHGWIKEDGDAKRSGFHPFHFLHCCFRSSSHISMVVNVLWPLVPAAIAVGFKYRHNTHPVLVFTINYLAMIPAANLIGFAGQELGRKLPHVLGVFIETTLGSIVEIILFSVLVSQPNGQFIYVVRAAILGSILANMLLCLGLCFIAGGFQRHDQNFHEVISEVGSGLLLVAGFGLVLPSAFAASATSDQVGRNGVLSNGVEENMVLNISRATAIILLLAYVAYVVFNMSSHHGKVSDVYEADEMNDQDRHKDLAKKKLTFTECIIALTIAIACVALIAVNLVLNIEGIVERGVSDQFMGLILVPLVEKVAEHLTAIDEAYDNMPNMALGHVLGATVQTALLNTPIVIFIGWGLGTPMDLNFKQFEAIVLILAILVMGNFLRDRKSDWLEGVLAVFIYIIIAVCAWYYPNPGEGETLTGGETGGEAGGAAARLLLRAAGL